MMPEPQQSFTYSPLRGRPELPQLEVPSLARERCALLARVCRDRSLFSEERLALLLRMADSTLAPTVLDPQSMPRVITSFAVSLAARWPAVSATQAGLQAAKERTRDLLAGLIQSHVTKFSAQELVHIVKALGAMKLRDPECAQALAGASERPMWLLGPKKVIEHLHGLDVLGLKSHVIATDAAEMMLPRLSELPVYAIHKLVGMLIDLPVEPSQILPRIGEALLPRVPDMSPRELATTVHLFLSGVQRPGPLLAAVACEAAKRASEFSQRELLDMLRELGENRSDETRQFLNAAIPFVVGFLAAGNLVPSRLASILGSYARAQVFSRELVMAASSQLVGRLDELTPSQVVRAVWALAAFSIQDERFLVGASKAIMPHMQSLEPRALACLAWAYSSVRWRDEQLFGRISEVAQASLPRFPAASLSGLVWSFGNVAIADRPLFERVARHVHEGNPARWMRSGRTAWGMAIAAPDLLPSCCAREDLMQSSGPVEWHQYYQALIVAGAVSPLEKFPMLAEIESTRSERPISSFEKDVRRILVERLQVPPQKIDSRRLVAGIETDFIVRTRSKPVVIECDGHSYHRTIGPNGGTPVGADILQDRVLERCGYEVFHILSSDFYGPNRAKVVEGLASCLRDQRERAPLPVGIRRLLP